MEKSAAGKRLKPFLDLPLGKTALGGAGLAGLTGLAALPGLLGAMAGTFGPAPYVSATKELAKRMKERKKGIFDFNNIELRQNVIVYN